MQPGAELLRACKVWRLMRQAMPRSPAVDQEESMWARGHAGIIAADNLCVLMSHVKHTMPSLSALCGFHQHVDMDRLYRVHTCMHLN